MPNALQKLIEAAAAEFARGVIQAIHNASLDDIREESQGASISKGGKPRAPVVKRGPGRPKGSPEALRRSDLIVAYVKAHPGTSGNEAREALGFNPNQWATYTKHAVQAGKLRKEGPRNATTYWAT